MTQLTGILLPDARTGPSVKRHRSEQSVETPANFFLAVRKCYGHIPWDLAASKENAKAFEFFTEADNALKQAWHKLDAIHYLYLNPPFDPITPWVKKCAEEARLGAKILLLCPTSIGANWWRDYVHHKAYVKLLQPRLQFVGHAHKYVKDLALCVYNRHLGEDTPLPDPYEYWRWDK